MNKFTTFVISFLSITFKCDCIDTQPTTENNIFNEYLLSTTSIGVIIAPQIPTNLVYLYEDCPLNVILQNYFIDANGLFYNAATQINTLYETKENELNQLVNNGILNNGDFRENVAAERSLMLETLSNMTGNIDNYILINMQWVDVVGLNISNVAANKVDASTLNGSLKSVGEIISQVYNQITDQWNQFTNTTSNTFDETDSGIVTFFATAITTDELENAVQKSVQYVQQSELNLKIALQNEENIIANNIFQAEQDIVNTIQSMCEFLN